MVKLSAKFKQVLNALAAADAGEFLSMSGKFRYLAPDVTVARAPAAAPAPATNRRKRIAFYLGGELPADIMNYVAQTCTRLQHDLTVLTFQSAHDTEALLAPYADMLAGAKIDLEVELLSGDTVSGLVRCLRRRPGIAFLACNEAGYLGRGLLNGTQSPEAFPVPVVLVAARAHAAPAGLTLPGQANNRTDVA